MKDPPLFSESTVFSLALLIRCHQGSLDLCSRLRRQSIQISQLYKREGSTRGRLLMAARDHERHNTNIGSGRGEDKESR